MGEKQKDQPRATPPGTNAGTGAGGPQRTGPGTGNPRGNDLPSDNPTKRDTRKVDGEPSTTRADPRDLKERRDEAQAGGAGRRPPGEQASGSGIGSGGETDFRSEPGL